MFGLSDKKPKQPVKKSSKIDALFSDEEIIQILNAGYLFVNGNGSVKYRTFSQHENELSERDKVYTDERKQADLFANFRTKE